jgi:pimeloyl-ACP methyl ester carboxylesterase
VQIAFDRTGDGPPLVLLHPLGCDRHVWDPVTERLARDHTVIAIDLPGFGESPPLTGVEPTPHALAEAVAVQLARMDLRRPHLAGNSLGGWVALELGLQDAVASVTAIAPAGLWQRRLAPKASVGHHVARTLLPLAERLMHTHAGRRVLLTGSIAHPERMSSRDAAHLVRVYARAPGFVAVNNAMRAGHFSGLERIRCPVTFVWPERDRLIERPQWIPETVRNIDIADAGHIPMWDAPREVAGAMLAGSRPQPLTTLPADPRARA